MVARKKASELIHTAVSGSEGKCPVCSNERVITIDSRISAFEGIYARRRRKACRECEHRWSTWEISETDLNVLREPHPKAIRRAVMKMLNGMTESA